LVRLVLGDTSGDDLKKKLRDQIPFLIDALHYYQVKLTGEMCIARIVSAS